MEFELAERSTARARIFIFGPSGNGKSVSGLLIGRGLTTDYGRILQVDTEHGRGGSCTGKRVGSESIGKFYCKRLGKPFTVQKYLEVLVEAEKSKKFDVIIFDSISHVWAGKGGLLERKDEFAKVNKNNDQRSDWAPITAEYQELVEAILQTNLHVIFTARSKTAWATEENDKGKLALKVVGLAPVMRDGFQYENSQILFMAEKGVAVNLKDDTDLLPKDEPFVPTIDTGKLIASWYAENEGTVKDSGLYGLKAEGYRKCDKCNGLMELSGTDEVGDLTVNIYRCKNNPSHVKREKAEG